MNRVNRISAILLIALFAIVTGCEKSDPDISVTDRDKFIGTWDGKSDGPNGHRDFSLVITASNSAPNQIKMQGFDGGAGTLFATVSGNNLTISSQIISGETIEGYGSYLNASLSFNFSINDGQGIEERTGSANNKH